VTTNITVSAGTARYGINAHGQRFKLTTKSRVIGVEVVCGPLHKFFTYYTDNLVSKGANIMIEVQRQGNCYFFNYFY
jgi:hypothetical protein